MGSDYIRSRLVMIFEQSMMDRIQLRTSLDGKVKKIIVDVHGMTCRNAERFINNVINLARGSCVVEVIHGYRHGTRIKDMLKQNFFNPNIVQIIPDQWNMGITYLQPN